MKKIPFLLIAILCCLVKAPFAQLQKIVGDKIIAQIDDKIILNSDIQGNASEEIWSKFLPECTFLEAQLIEKALVLEAGKDSISISDDELNAMLDKQIETFVIQYGSRQELEQIAGKSVYQLKEELREPFKERKLADEMRNKILENVKITPTGVKDYFEKIPKDSVKYYESEYEISQIIVYAKPNKDVEEYATNQLLEWKRQVESGQKKFEDLAKVYDQYPDSRDHAGQYNVNKNDEQWDPTWFTAIWKLRDGQISPVVKSRFGLHIIQMVSRAGDEAIIRHILLIPSVTQAEINDAKTKLDSIRAQLLTGNINFGAAVNKFSEDENGKNNGGQIISQDGSSFVTIDQLDKDMTIELKNMNPGDISKPLVYKDDRDRDAVRLIYLRARKDFHRENLKDDYDKIAQRALEQKKNHVLQKWFADHIPEFYVSVDKSFCNCVNLDPWLNAAKTCDAAQ